MFLECLLKKRLVRLGSKVYLWHFREKLGKYNKVDHHELIKTF